jgi:hypothetical protein
MNELITHDDENDQDGVDITAITKYKHADLWAASKKLGSQSALAKYLGISVFKLNTWINLRVCPSMKVTKYRTEENILRLEAKLMELTGKSMEELFPPMLRNNKRFLAVPKTTERTARITAIAMCDFMLATQERIKRLGEGIDLNETKAERSTILEKVLSENLSPRSAEILKMRFGIGQPNNKRYTYKEMTSIFKLKVERLRQLEIKALDKLRNTPKIMKLLGEYYTECG